MVAVAVAEWVVVSFFPLTDVCGSVRGGDYLGSHFLVNI